MARTIAIVIVSGIFVDGCGSALVRANESKICTVDVQLHGEWFRSHPYFTERYARNMSMWLAGTGRLPESAPWFLTRAANGGR
jgi:hypothetical protein